ncbi:MAG: GxxExxY protein [Candidatus Neomarinimicrobiota bacterium]|jgi:GxxExxY protein|nr:GxxExxY protein [Candidatus Neomarinimicrobiota bacterium]
MENYKYQEITEKIIKGFYETYNELGNGFLEVIYEKALTMVLSKMGLTVESQKPVEVFFRKRMIGQFYVDMVVDGKVIVELKAVRHLLPEHESQILNYLKATQYEVGLLLHFGLKPEIKRFLFDNSRK